MKRMLGVAAVAAGLLAWSAGVAQASEQGYLDTLSANGMTYGGWFGIASPAEAIRAGNAVCANIKYSGNPRAGFNLLTNNSMPDYLIAAAQHELCPDTL